MNQTINITRGTDVILNDTLKYNNQTFDPSLAVNLQAFLISPIGKRTELQLQIIDDYLVISIPWDDNRATGLYGLEVRGTTNGLRWATYADSLIRYTTATIQEQISQVSAQADPYEIQQVISYRYGESPIAEINVSCDNAVGTPSVQASYINRVLQLAFHNLKGNTGNGILSITPVIVSTEDGGTNTFRITFTDGAVFDFSVKNGDTGNGIANITKIAESDEDGGTNTWRITLDDGSTTDFSLKNGATGNGISSINQIASSNADGGTNTWRITLSNGTSIDLSLKNGTKGTQGDSVLVGQGDLPLANDLGDSSQKAITQQAVTKAINGYNETSYEEITDLVADKFFNTNSSYNSLKSGDKTGCYRKQINDVTPGDKFLISANDGNNGSYRLYVWCYLSDNGNIAYYERAATGTQWRNDPHVITAPDGPDAQHPIRYLLVNLYGYNSETDYIKKVITTHMDGIKDELNETVRFTEQSLTSEQKAKARENIGITDDTVRFTGQTLTSEQKQQAQANLGLSVDDLPTVNSQNVVKSGGVFNALKQQKDYIDETIGGTDEISYETETEGYSNDGKYYNFRLETIGNPASETGYKCAKIPCVEGEKFRIAGQSGNDLAFRQYCFCSGTNGTAPITGSYGDKNADTRAEPITVTAPATATYLLVNFKAYNAETDYIERVIVNHTNGLMDDVAESLKFTTQTLTAEQKAKALENLGIDKEQIEAASRLAPIVIHHAKYAGSPGTITIPMQNTDGVYRVKVQNVENPAQTNKVRLYYRDSSKSGTAALQYASVNTPQGQWIPLVWFEKDNFTFDQLYVFIAGTSSGTYEVWIEQIDTPYQKEKNDRTILLFGDSISQVNAQNSGATLRDSMRWSDWLRCYMPGVKIHNLAIGGTRYSRRFSRSTTPNSTQALAAMDIVSLVSDICDNDYTYLDPAAERLLNNDGKAISSKVVARAKAAYAEGFDKVTDVILMAGFNDWFSGTKKQDSDPNAANDPTNRAVLGTIDSADDTTIFGALNIIISKICTTMPNAKVYLVTQPPIYRWDSPRTEANWGDNWHDSHTGLSLADIMDGIRLMAAKWHLEIIDVHKEIGWNQFNYSQFFPDTDSHHPIYGFDKIANFIAKRL